MDTFHITDAGPISKSICMNMTFIDILYIYIYIYAYIYINIYLQGAIFYVPRLIWLHLEEGKLSSMIGGVRGGAAIAQKNHDKIKEASKNVVKYLEMKEAGHYMYGMGYLFCQVRR